VSHAQDMIFTLYGDYIIHRGGEAREPDRAAEPLWPLRTGRPLHPVSHVPKTLADKPQDLPVQLLFLNAQEPRVIGGGRTTHLPASL
jgi:hypothetical protein